MASSDSDREILVLRDRLRDVVTNLATGDAESAMDSLRACNKSANRYFAEDEISLESFKLRLKAIRDLIRSNSHSEATEMTRGVLVQLEQLAMMQMSEGNLPELTEELQTSAAMMTRLDMNIGHICQWTWGYSASRTEVTRDQVIPMLWVFMVTAFETVIETPATASEILEEYREKHPEQAANFQVITDNTIRSWEWIREQAKEAEMPILEACFRVWFSNHLEKTIDTPDSLDSGWFYTSGRFLYGSALTFADSEPDLARKLLQQVEKERIRLQMYSTPIELDPAFQLEEERRIEYFLGFGCFEGSIPNFHLLMLSETSPSDVKLIHVHLNPFVQKFTEIGQLEGRSWISYFPLTQAVMTLRQWPCPWVVIPHQSLSVRQAIALLTNHISGYREPMKRVITWYRDGMDDESFAQDLLSEERSGSVLGAMIGRWQSIEQMEPSRIQTPVALLAIHLSSLRYNCKMPEPTAP